MSQQTLMLNIEGRATPYAFQVPEPTFQKYKDHQGPNLWHHENLITQIEDHADEVVRDLFFSIEKWRTKSYAEIDRLESHEAAQVRAKNLFT